jgi:transcriptional regulator with XRE-family HTH domain
MHDLAFPDPFWVSNREIANYAGVSVQTIANAKRGKSVVNETLRALKPALRKLCDASKNRDRDLTLNYRATLAMVCTRFGVDPASVDLGDVGTTRDADQAFRQRDAFLRHVTAYVLNVICNVPQVEVARAAMVTRAAMHLAIKGIDQLYDQHPAFAAVIDELDSYFNRFADDT